MAYMVQLADGRVVPQTTLPEHLWRGKLVKPKKAAKTGKPAKPAKPAKQKFRVEVTESYHDTFDIEADSEQEAREIAEEKLDNEELTCRHGEYDRTINHCYPVQGE